MSGTVAFDLPLPDPTTAPDGATGDSAAPVAPPSDAKEPILRASALDDSEDEAEGGDYADAAEMVFSDTEGDGNASGLSSGATTPALSRSNSTSGGESGVRAGWRDLREGESPLLDFFETFIDSRVDLMERKRQEIFRQMKYRARKRREELVRQAKKSVGKAGSGLGMSPKEMERLDAELQKAMVKISARVNKFSRNWQDAKVVKLREKFSFMLGVMNLFASSLLFGLAPEYIHVWYTVQALYFLPIRYFTYKKKSWHYFLADYCYFANVLNLIYIWIFPESPFLLATCYCIAHGPLAWAVMAWRNSLVFHSLDKVTSLFIHLYPPFVFSTIRHFLRTDVALKRFPALAKLPHLSMGRALYFNIAVYSIWQLGYWRMLSVRQAQKIKRGQRMTSFSFLASDHKSSIGKVLGKVPENYREFTFMAMQFIYTILTMLPAFCVFYDSSVATACFLVGIFTLSVWNGATFYVDVFATRFEKELNALRAEMAAASAREAGDRAGGGALTESPTEVRREVYEDGGDEGGQAEGSSGSSEVEKKREGEQDCVKGATSG